MSKGKCPCGGNIFYSTDQASDVCELCGRKFASLTLGGTKSDNSAKNTSSSSSSGSSSSSSGSSSSSYSSSSYSGSSSSSYSSSSYGSSSYGSSKSSSSSSIDLFSSTKKSDGNPNEKHTALVRVVIVMLAALATFVLFFVLSDKDTPSTDNNVPPPNKTGEFVIEYGMLVSYDGYDETVVIPDDVSIIGKNAFKNSGPQKYMKKVVMNENLTSIEKNAFKNCDALKEVQFNNSLLYIGKNAFLGCDGLEEINVPSSVKHIYVGAFKKCRNLKNLTLNEGLEIIYASAFKKCYSLRSVTIPNSVVTVGNQAFGETNNLSALFLNKNAYLAPQIINFTWGNDGTFTVIYYPGSEEEFKSLKKSPAWSGKNTRFSMEYNYNG